MAMENFQCSMKLVHYLCLSRIFTNDRDSISFKIFGHDVSFTLEDFHIMCGLRITPQNVEKPINRESNILKQYFSKSKESILFGKNTELSVMEEYASIVEDDKVCAEYPWGNVAYEKLIYSLKHALDKQNKLHTTEYKLSGFTYPLCAWFYERFPNVWEKYIREDEYLDTPQVPRMLSYVCVGEPKFLELYHMFSTHERYRDFRVLDIIPTEEELNSMPLIGQLPCSRIRSKVVNAVPSTGESPRTLSRSKEVNRTPVIGESPRSRSRSKEPNRTLFIGESSRTQSRSTRSTSDFDGNELLETICSRLTTEVQRHAEKERSMIVNEEYFDEKFEQLFKIVNKSNEMDDGNFDLSNHREYDRVIDCYEHPSDINGVDDASDKVADVNATREEAASEGDQHVQKQVEEERSSADILSRDRNYEEQLATANVGSKQCADNQVEEHAAHDPSRKVADDNATRKEAAGECDEYVQQQGADDQVVVEVETSCASIDTTQKVFDDAELNEGRVEKNLPQNTPMLLDVGAQLNETGNVDIEKGMQSGKTTTEDKRQERLEAAQKEFGELIQLYQKGEIHLFTHVGSQTSVKCVDTGISEVLFMFIFSLPLQISPDASQLIANPKRRKIFSSPMCDTSDIPIFNLCSFSLDSTQRTDSEGNSTVVVVREERQEHREQKGVGQLVVMEQQEEQAKGKPKKGKRIHMESSGLIQRFTKWLEMDTSEYDSNPFRLAGIDIRKSFFTELMDPNSDLADEHMDVGIYYLRKKYCYHLPAYPKSRFAVTDLIFY
ncbi:uncharacterized protein [Nicotiana sylvestris]|uniref:uncharacterized protein n=1 Tax=Nicotiana sylvestris TaxID=4096 RepID=UPI00388C82C2